MHHQQHQTLALVDQDNPAELRNSQTPTARQGTLAWCALSYQGHACGPVEHVHAVMLNGGTNCPDPLEAQHITGLAGQETKPCKHGGVGKISGTCMNCTRARHPSLDEGPLMSLPVLHACNQLLLRRDKNHWGKAEFHPRCR